MGKLESNVEDDEHKLKKSKVLNECESQREAANRVDNIELEANKLLIENVNLDEEVNESHVNSSANRRHLVDDDHSDGVIKRLGKNINKKYYGILLGLLSALFLSLSNIFIKKARYLSGIEQAAVRYALQLVIMILIARYNKLNIFGDRQQRRLLAFRGLFGMTALICLHISVKLIDPSESVGLLHTNVIGVALMSRIFLNEKFSLLHLLSIILTFVGIVFIAQPKFLFNNLFISMPYESLNSSSNQTLTNAANLTLISIDQSDNGLKIFLTQNARVVGILIGLFSSLASAIVAILLKKLSNQKVHYSIAIVYASYFGLPTCLLITSLLHLTNYDVKNSNLVRDAQSILQQIVFSMTSAMSGVFSQMLMNIALKYEDASKVSIARTCDLFFTFLFQYFILDIVSNVFSTLGALLILAAAVLIVVIKFYMGNENNQQKYKNHFLFKQFL